MEPAAGSSPSLSMSPTITTPAMTQAGMILGTAAYMSPEQAKGRPVDRRADMWAFGVVLYEMLTGKRAFPGEDITDTLAAVLRAEPDWRGELLGGPAFSMGSRVSPDGQTVAFQAMENGVTQVAVVRQRSAQWATLTHDRDHGVLIDIEWSPDGSSIYFDRLRDVPQGIYRVPVLGGEPRLVLARAGSPVPLPDSTLLVAQIDSERRKQIFRFWPETGRLEST